MKSKHMHRRTILVVVGVLVAGSVALAVGARQGLSVETAPPVVVKTVPQAGSDGIDPSITELRVTYSKPMQDQSWSWVQLSEEQFPKTTGRPRYLKDGRTCVLPVRLEPGRTYALGLNHQPYNNFMDESGRAALPYLLVFETAEAEGQP